MLTVARLFLLLVTAMVCAGARLGAQTVPNEYRLKAAFLYQFPQFIEWPPAALEGGKGVQLCVVAPNPFGPDLEDLVRGESLSGRPFLVREIASASQVEGCHVVFVAGAASQAVTAAVLKVSAARPILTVGEDADFLDAGGIIALRVVDRRIRFEVDAANAQRSGLRISSQLLGLALAVRGGPS